MPAAAAIVLKCPSAVHLNLLGGHQFFTDLGTSPPFETSFTSGLPLLMLPDDLLSLQCKDLLDTPDDPFCESLSHCLHRWTQLTCLELTGSEGGIDVGDCQHPLP